MDGRWHRRQGVQFPLGRIAEKLIPEAFRLNRVAEQEVARLAGKNGSKVFGTGGWPVLREYAGTLQPHCTGQADFTRERAETGKLGPYMPLIDLIVPVH